MTSGLEREREREALVSVFKKNLLAGFDSIEEVISARKFETLSRAVPIPVSSRAIGFSVQDTLTRVTRIPANAEQLPPVSVYHIYRVCLAMMEFKIYQTELRPHLMSRLIGIHQSSSTHLKT